MLQIPVTTTGNQDFDITLEGTTYTFQYRYNARNSRIYLNVLKDGDNVASGMRLIEGSTPMGYYVSADLPPGLFFVANLMVTEEIATLGNLGIDEEYSLIYMPITEFTF